MTSQSKARWAASKLLLALAILMSGCSAGEAVHYPNGLVCRSVTVVRGLPVSGQDPLSVGSELDCQYTCPDGSVVSMGPAIVNASSEQLDHSIWCVGDSPATATPPALSASSTSSPVNPSMLLIAASTAVPTLQMDVSSCDPAARYINFRLSEPSAWEDAALKVELNGNPAECNMLTGSASILSCRIPAATMFPLLVVVRLDEVVISHFTYNGALCSIIPSQEPRKQDPAGIPRHAPTPTNAPSWLPTHVPPTKEQPTSPPSTEPGHTNAPPTESG
jgi:hypothetical protein